MAKEQKSPEQLKEAVATAKEELKAAKEERRAFEKENKLAKDTDHSGHEKLGKKWSKLNDVVTKKQAALDKAKEAAEGAKKEKAPRATTYEYPKNEKGEEMSAAEKKRYRAKMRAAKNKAEKGEEAPKAGKKEKKEKKGKKEKKEAAAAAEAED